MPIVGEVKRGRELGRLKSVYTRSKRLIFCRCPDCGSERWLILRPATSSGISRCQTCCGKAMNSTRILPHGRMENSPHWKGGRHLTGKRGYVDILISKDDPYYPMSTHKKDWSGRIPEHRYIMAKHLGRCLAKSEQVHHINGIKDDNRLENLELVSPANHALYNQLCSHCKLRKQVRALRKEIKLLKAQLPKMI